VPINPSVSQVERLANQQSLDLFLDRRLLRRDPFGGGWLDYRIVGFVDLQFRLQRLSRLGRSIGLIPVFI
jgi:hypothetical protein